MNTFAKQNNASLRNMAMSFPKGFSICVLLIFDSKPLHYVKAVTQSYQEFSGP